jgi:hypothetical protein
MDKRRLIGMALVLISMILSLTNILAVKITGGFLGVNVESSFLTVLTFVFFFVGIFILGSLDEKVSNWVKAAAIAGTIGLVGLPAITSIKEKRSSASEKNVDIENTVKVISPYSTTQGRFERTYRWDKVLDEIEGRYELPRGILKGLAMRESYGDPLRLNKGNDGGAGLFMFQPRTAKAYGLKVHGNSDRSSADTTHGAELKDLVEFYNHDYGKLAEIDERFDIKKSAEAAAKYLREDYTRYGSWDKALSAYNQGKPAPNASETKHVKAVNEYTEYYNQRDKMDHNRSSQNVGKKVNSKKKTREKRVRR